MQEAEQEDEEEEQEEWGQSAYATSWPNPRCSSRPHLLPNDEGVGLLRYLKDKLWPSVGQAPEARVTGRHRWP